MPTRYLRLGPREQDTGSDDTSRRTEQDEEEFWPKLDKKTADRIGILNRWIYPVCRSVVTESLKTRVRCGLISLSLQTRCTVALETPNSRAIVRHVHRAPPRGGPPAWSTHLR